MKFIKFLFENLSRQKGDKESRCRKKLKQHNQAVVVEWSKWLISEGTI